MQPNNDPAVQAPDGEAVEAASADTRRNEPKSPEAEPYDEAAREEETAVQTDEAEEEPQNVDDILYRAASTNPAVRARIIGDYLESLKGVPLMTVGGTGVSAPKQKVSSFAEAGKLALGYFRTHRQN